MRPVLEHLARQIDDVYTDNIYQAISELKQHMQTMLKLIDKALPAERSLD